MKGSSIIPKVSIYKVTTKKLAQGDQVSITVKEVGLTGETFQEKKVMKLKCRFSSIEMTQNNIIGRFFKKMTKAIRKKRKQRRRYPRRMRLVREM